jgi:hypothetical protein
MGANGNGNVGYDAKVWDQIQAEWLAGQLSLSDISRTYGPSRSTIRAKAKRFNWPPRGCLVEQVRKEIQSQLLEEGAPVSAPPIEASEIVESAAKRGVAIVRRERHLLSRLLGVADVTLEELENIAVISQETLKKKRTKAQVQLVAALSKAKIDGMRAVSQILSQAIPLERLAYSLDKDGGQERAIIYEAPDYRKPKFAGLAEDEWDKKSYSNGSHGARHNWHKRVG